MHKTGTNSEKSNNISRIGLFLLYYYTYILHLYRLIGHSYSNSYNIFLFILFYYPFQVDHGILQTVTLCYLNILLCSVYSTLVRQFLSHWVWLVRLFAGSERQAWLPAQHAGQAIAVGARALIDCLLRRCAFRLLIRHRRIFILDAMSLFFEN